VTVTATVAFSRWRKLGLAVVLAAQTVFFFFLMDRPLQVFADNPRYETAGYNLAIGKGISLPYEQTRDPLVKSWVCTRHPEACTAADGTHPTALYPPGYSFFIAGIYKIAGRSILTVAAAQLVLLWLMFILFERMALRLLDPVGYWFAMGMAATYPFIARHAAMIMSDHLNAVLLLASLASLLMLKPGALRGIAFGGLMAATALTRPYALLVFPAIMVWPHIRRALNCSTKELVLAVVVFSLPLGSWTLRNAYWFGKFIPMTTYKMGTSLLWTTYEWEADVYDAKDEWRRQELGKLIAGEPCAIEVNERTMAMAIERIKANPGKFAWRILVHVPRNWVSLGYLNNGLSRGWPLLLLYLGGNLALGLWGMWLRRRDARWHPIMITILLYWAMLLPLLPEARRTLALRLPMLLFAGVAVSHAVGWYLARRRTHVVASASVIANT
jgi:hypothetical protein